ncbi:MAG: hypothetical protein C5B53_05525 [Candidatus Melainabacteria bacterium]|nr:MAG: hypothetical protein C5B53_05525 [Candidatus Melainabacteria bacterium]
MDFSFETDKPTNKKKGDDAPPKDKPTRDPELINTLRDITTAVGSAAQGGDSLFGLTTALAVASKNEAFKISSLISKLGSKDRDEAKTAFEELFDYVKSGSKANEQLMAAIKGKDKQIADRAWTALSWRISPTHSLIRDFNLDPFKKKGEDVTKEELIRRFVKARTSELERIREGTKLDDFDKNRIEEQIKELRSHLKD